MHQKMKRERDQDDSDKEEEETPIPQESEKDATKEVEEPTTSKRKRKRKRKKKAAAAADAVAGDADTGGDLTTDQKMDSLEHTVYVEGIPFDCSEDKVKNFFSENGCPDVIQLRLPRYVLQNKILICLHLNFFDIHDMCSGGKILDGCGDSAMWYLIQWNRDPKPWTHLMANIWDVVI
jgi:hypothetical protein